MSREYAAMMLQMPLFRGFTEVGAQRLIDLGEIQEHAPGGQICKEGDPATCVLLVLSGRVQAYVERAGSELVVADCGPGALLGEIALLCGIPRATSARAMDRSVVLYWAEGAFRSIMFGDPFFSHRIFSTSLRFLIDHEKSVIESLANNRREIPSP